MIGEKKRQKFGQEGVTDAITYAIQNEQVTKILDIVGTAGVDTPVWEFQSAGATGAAVTTLYYLGKEQEGRK